FRIKIRRKLNHFFVGEEEVTEAIRTPEVTRKVVEVSALPLVRETLVARQRAMAEGINAVFEGRDMGSHVFPHADLKIFLTGDAEVRARRRLEEVRKKMPNRAEEFTLQRMIEEINLRDTCDSTREHSPLVKAEDAYEIDTSNLDIEDVVHQILECKDVRKRMATRIESLGLSELSDE
ncbi:MAG: (d)CMP kinase, partial [Chlamydiia bacterium]|nr:(d)CMP kinase [Chlamydiia bacterium]